MKMCKNSLDSCLEKSKQNSRHPLNILGAGLAQKDAWGLEVCWRYVFQPLEDYVSEFFRLQRYVGNIGRKIYGKQNHLDVHGQIVSALVWILPIACSCMTQTEEM